ncbi:DNA repair protein RadC [Candidatus Saganbacteria bacterium]|uniref:DNA repair protein RadC n=1 Tax=Candidatus Saganbacteria bacterium TaxID=2575572 RepID=A0A9D6YSX7_UNCSA|nr:DNA repair protein RadC [Candidatus Saganbacteria bacterium]
MDSIRNWPENERPREKLIKHGAERLSDAELLAIFLRTGIKGKTALELARNLLEKFGGLRKLLNAGFEAFRAVKGLGPAKITQLKAVIELGSRYLKEGMLKKPALASSKSVFRFLYHTMRDLDHEILRVLLLNAQNEIIRMEDIARGSVSRNSIQPRDIISPALKYHADGIMLIHNHPSGSPNPSQKDKKMTAEFFLICRLLKIRLLDHIIIGDNRYYSFADEGML